MKKKKKKKRKNANNYRRFVFVQDLIVLGHRNAKYDRGNILEAMDPFLTFASLAAHVEQSVKKQWYTDEQGFGNSLDN